MNIEHDQPGQRFLAHTGEGTAVLAYDRTGDRVMDIYSTFVPPAARGRGIAARLVEAAVAHARAEGYRIIPSCSYVVTWLRAHPDQTDLIRA